ncbi:MAG TPA: SPOR domain-containing protein [Acetobacteraceae bacterium]|nr:SPOR domain-containing protein [Acetobacteraceae bacterium]
MSDDISIPSPTYRVPRHRGADPATRRLALIAAGLGGALVVVVGGWSMLGGGHHGVPVIEPQSGPTRIKPANPGGLQVQGLGNDIFSGGSDSSVDKLAPPPEVPNPQALRAPPPKPVVQAAQPAVLPPPAAPAAAATPVQAPPPARAVAADHAPSMAAADHPLAKPPVQPAIAHDKPVARVGGGTTMVQLAALSTEAAAKDEWRNLSRRIPGLLSGHQPVFSRVDHAGHQFWRVRTGGFADQAAARGFCQRVHAKGLACSVADF